MNVQRLSIENRSACQLISGRIGTSQYKKESIDKLQTAEFRRSVESAARAAKYMIIMVTS